MSYTASEVQTGKDPQEFGGKWYAHIVLHASGNERNDAVAGHGDTRQEAVKDLVKQVLKMEQMHRAANEALVAFLGEDAT